MNKLKIVKKKLKELNIWYDYQNIFRHKQMKLLFSKVSLLFDEEITIDFLVEKEIELSKIKKDDQSSFVKTFLDLSSFDKLKTLDWKSFGLFVYYVYQTSTYWYDKRHKNKNIFLDNDYTLVNAIKRDLYHKFINSIDVKDPNYNNKIIKLLRLVF